MANVAPAGADRLARSQRLRAPGPPKRSVTLGDYADRGPRGIAVLEFLGQYDPPDVRVTRLRGNHDMFLETFLRDDAIDLDFVAMWLANGGGATLRELGIERADFSRARPSDASGPRPRAFARGGGPLPRRPAPQRADRKLSVRPWRRRSAAPARGSRPPRTRHDARTVPVRSRLAARFRRRPRPHRLRPRRQAPSHRLRQRRFCDRRVELRADRSGPSALRHRHEAAGPAALGSIQASNRTHALTWTEQPLS